MLVLLFRSARFHVFLCTVLCWAASAAAQSPSTEAIAHLKDLDGHFPFAVPATREEWNSRADALRLQVQVALGVHPLPPLSIATPTIHGRIERDGYSIEKIYFESLPGFFVTGSLYRPRGSAAPQSGYPAVMYAHGHWANGRFYEAGRQEVRQLLASGAERFENAAINHMQAACVQLARMGCVVLQYDMIGYADSGQISFERAHGYGRDQILNPAESSDGWLLFSAAAEGYNQSVMALQALNSIRGFEALCSLADVDDKRIAITGASGGGTQSFITSAVEPRLAGAFPAVMVSTSMQGGCTCENACGLRVGTGNVEIAALTAPRPLAMTTAQDWTLKMPQDGFPQLQALYALFGKKNAVTLYPGPQFPHNYNHVTRVGMYGWINRLFDLGLPEPILERDFELTRQDQLTVWDADHPKPTGGTEFEKQLTSQWAETIDRAMEIQASDNAETKASKTERLRQGWHVITAPAISLAAGFSASTSQDGVALRLAAGEGEVFASSQRHGADSTPPGSAVTLLLGDALQSLPGQHAGDKATAVYTCTIGDPVGGEDDKQPLVANPRPAAAYTYGYNSPRLIRKLAALVRIIEETSNQQKQPIQLVVSGDDAVLAAAALLQLAPQTLERVTILGDRSQITDPFDSVDGITHNAFVPGSLRYQGWEGLQAVVDPSRLEFKGGS